MRQTVFEWIKNLLKYGLGIGLLIYILHQNWEPKADSKGIRGLLEETPDYGLLALLITLAVTCTSCQILRWYVLVRALDLPFRISLAFKLGLVGCFWNAFAPGSVGGDLVKGYYIARGQPGRRAAAVATVLTDRLVGLFGLIWFSAAFGIAFWATGDERVADNEYLKSIVRVCSTLVVIAVLGWAVLGLLTNSRAESFGKRLATMPGGNILAEVWFAVWTYRQRPRVIYATIAMTAVVHMLFVLMFHLAVRVFPAENPASFPEHLVVIPIGFIAQAFFPVPGGVGGGEAIFGELYHFLGRAKATGVMGRLTLRVNEWAIGIVGLFFFLRMRANLHVVEDEMEQAPLDSQEVIAEIETTSPH